MTRGLNLSSAKANARASFTLVEVLAVMAIIGILIGLVLAAYNGIQRTAARKRALNEIAAISTALESYKVDNGAYPEATVFGSTAGYLTPPTGAAYQNSSELLFQALTGRTNFTDIATSAGYITFKPNQLGNNSAGSGPVYVKDPFGFSYGYYSGSTTTPAPYNGTNFFDLWSTGGDTTGTKTNAWIDNWSS